MDSIFTARGLFSGGLLGEVGIGLSFFLIVRCVYMEIWINGQDEISKTINKDKIKYLSSGFLVVIRCFA